MNELQIREILAQEYERAGFRDSRVDEIRNGTGLLPDRTQAALNACIRVRDWAVKDCIDAVERVKE